MKLGEDAIAKGAGKARIEIEGRPELAYAGILSAHKRTGDGYVLIRALRPARNLPTARKLNPEEYLKIAHLAMMRFWEWRGS